MMSVESLKLAAQIRSKGTSTEKQLLDLLLDENLQVLSTFELNKMASLSYNDETCDQIFNLLEEVMFQPMEFSILAVTKAIVVAKHILIYGSEDSVSSCIGLGRHIDQLREFNTVIWAQKQQGLGSIWHNIKGGGVDRGYPVRDEAQKLHALIQDQNKIRQLRNDKADPNSLVPVGDDKVGFISDEVRLYMLNKRMEEHQLLRTRSNLVKADGGFGSGFQSKSGQTVVGAAHSLEEMMERAAREKKKFSDSGPIHYRAPKPVVPEPKPTIVALPPKPPAAPTVDLLDFTEPAPAPTPAVTTAAAPPVDLLDFSADPAPPPAPKPKPQEPVSLLDLTSPAPVPAPIASVQAPSSDFYNVTTLLDDGKVKTFDDTGDLLEDFPTRGLANSADPGDLLGLAAPAPPPAQPSVPTQSSVSDPFGGMGLPPSSAAEVPAPESVSISISDAAPTATNGLLSHLNILRNGTVNKHGVSLSISDAPPAAAPSPSVMSTNADRFSALDDMAPPETKTAGSILTGVSAQNRILGFSSTSAPPPASLPASTTMPSLMGMSSVPLPVPSEAPRPPRAADGVFLSGLGATNGGTMDGITLSNGGLANGMIGQSDSGLVGIGMSQQPAYPENDLTMAGRNGFPEPMAPPPSYMMPEPEPEPVPVITSSLKAMGITAGYGGDEIGDDDDCGFLMGGSTGDGLEPTAPMPSMAPPPPPPPMF